MFRGIAMHAYVSVSSAPIRPVIGVRPVMNEHGPHLPRGVRAGSFLICIVSSPDSQSP